MKKTRNVTWGGSQSVKCNGFPVHLTQRQREVLVLLCEGLPNKTIGRELALSDATVKCHVASILRSLNVESRLRAVAVAFQHGLVRLGGNADEPASTPSQSRPQPSGFFDGAIAL